MVELTAVEDATPEGGCKSWHGTPSSFINTGAARGGSNLLRILTWNTLAPVYFRGGGKSGAIHDTEAELPEAYLARHARIIAVMLAIEPDVICLQEQWFEPRLMDFYEERFASSGYRFEALRRTAWNCDGRTEDGVAILFRQQSMQLLHRHDVRFHDYGIPQDRVALLLRMRDVRRNTSRAEGCEWPHPRLQRMRQSLSDEYSTPAVFAVLCTHLTYPHSTYDVESRAQQIGACLHAVDRHVGPGIPVVVAGDLNGHSGDMVGQHLRRAGFYNAWEELHGRSCEITHTDHRGHSFASDHIWARGESFTPAEVLLLPQAAPDTRRLLRPTVGSWAKRPAQQTGLASFEDWCELSDHRALLGSLRWAGQEDGDDCLAAREPLTQQKAY